ncbi:hypothetical protein FQS90_14175 [Enterococcus casseliflavus]|uniref:hypothetical protein n=1 Tax=Enterococcus sp. 8E11_MSG4843 TaxID=1834190 RepID=UPI000B3E8CB8|nr:hypothetical protein [Enterococcus sp. 8E11_MSG4843]MBO1097660.1 hypothetical protein [Enterococcus casseliflavus]MBO1144816.1 hypothetical protein [Enterococcus casseliflavus]OUZ28275.1 hypothetical protein A5885_003616 [Enterococcus sp. 8E11_MSG4843]
MDISQALEILEREGITNSVQMVRRWIRQGKIKAKLPSKKNGYDIDPHSLEKFIEQKKDQIQDIQTIDFKKGFQMGYKQAKNEYKEKMRTIVVRGGFEERFSINRLEFHSIAANRERSKEYFSLVDDQLFAYGVKRARANIEVYYLDGWYAYERATIVIHEDDYNIDLKEDTLLEDKAMNLLSEYFRIIYMNSQIV